MIEKAGRSSPTLVGDSALRGDVDQPWEQDNQAHVGIRLPPEVVPE